MVFTSAPPAISKVAVAWRQPCTGCTPLIPARRSSRRSRAVRLNGRMGSPPLTGNRNRGPAAYSLAPGERLFQHAGLLGAQQRHHRGRDRQRAARRLGLGDLADDHRGPGLGDGALDGERRRLEVERVKREAEQLRSAQSGGEQQRQHAIGLGIRLGGREQRLRSPRW